MDYINNVISHNILPWLSGKGLEILWAVIFGVAGWWGINKSRKFLIIFMQRANMDQSVVTFLDSLSTVALRIILVIVILPHIGINTSSIVTTLGVSLAAVGLALKDSLSNIASGVLMIVYKPFCVGDFIEVGSISGTVTKIEMMFTTLMSRDGKLIIVPNSKLTSESIIRTGDHNIQRSELIYNISGDYDSESIKKVLQRIIVLNDKVLQIPPVEISIIEKQDGAREIRLVFWSEIVNQSELKSNIAETTQKFFAKHKLEIL